MNGDVLLRQDTNEDYFEHHCWTFTVGDKNLMSVAFISVCPTFIDFFHPKGSVEGQDWSQAIKPITCYNDKCN